MKRIFFLYLAFVTVFGITKAKDSPQTVNQFKLGNGLTVILNEDHSQPEVFGGIVVKAGNKYDLPDNTGQAHFLERLLFNGTKTIGTSDFAKEKPYLDAIARLYEKLSDTQSDAEREKILIEINQNEIKAAQYGRPSELSNLLASIGSRNIDAYSDGDYSFYYNSFPPSQTLRWLDLYSQRFIDPVFRSFQSELGLIYEEKNQFMDQFQSVMFQEFMKSFYKEHPYGQQDRLGEFDHLRNPSIYEMREFFKTYYVANNMALILSGDFSSEEVKPMIEMTFGKLPSGSVPSYPVFEEQAFRGREFVEVAMSPIPAGIVGFRTVTLGHPDYSSLELIRYMLYNQSGTGFLNDIAHEGKLERAFAFHAPRVDHGAFYCSFLPIDNGQTIAESEVVTMEQIHRLRAGDFTEEELETAKNGLLRDRQNDWESLEERGFQFAVSFAGGMQSDAVINMDRKIREITKDEIIRVASNYLGDKFLSFHFKEGELPKEKLTKPPFQPVRASGNARSAYAKTFFSIPEQEMTPRFVNFQSDIQERDISGGKLYYSFNPLNEVFTLNIKFRIGNYHSKPLPFAAELMNMAGTSSYSSSKLKRKFESLGCSYEFISNDNYFIISLKGLEKNIDEALNLLGKLLNERKIQDSNLEKVLEEEKTRRKIRAGRPIFWGKMLFYYGVYGENSQYLRELTSKELKSLSLSKLDKTILDAMAHECEVHYCGQLPVTDISQSLDKHLPLPKSPVAAKTPMELAPKVYNQNQVLLIHDNNVTQNRVYFYIPGESYQAEDEALAEAFNAYFGDNRSGVVAREIRAYRSLASTAIAQFFPSTIPGVRSTFRSAIICQSDKTMEVLEVMSGLLRELPEETEQIEVIKSSLKEKAVANRPDFRLLTETYLSWKNKGFSADPNQVNIDTFEQLDMNAVKSFFNRQIKGKPMMITIYGDKNSIDMNKLKAFGKITEIGKKTIVSH